ncbi:MAG: ATP-dependent RecD-like DNA helicase [Acidimicrobiia bacterium]|nr:ATP-dependent RecD-like DNA helicase [Acidimicrobiia bacterium]
MRNDYLNHLNNGDVGVLVAGGGRPAVAFPAPDGIRELATSQLGDVETWWAMTIHKSQGSEFRRVIVSLPRHPHRSSPRASLHGHHRASEQVTLVAGEAALRAAVATPVARASGLGERLWP